MTSRGISDIYDIYMTVIGVIKLVCSVLCVYELSHLNSFIHQYIIIPSRVSGRGYKIGPVCVCVCQLVSTLTAELFDLRMQNEQ